MPQYVPQTFYHCHYCPCPHRVLAPCFPTPGLSHSAGGCSCETKPSLTSRDGDHPSTQTESYLVCMCVGACVSVCVPSDGLYVANFLCDSGARSAQKTKAPPPLPPPSFTDSNLIQSGMAAQRAADGFHSLT